MLFSQKAWLNSYSKRGQPDADERLTRAPGGYIWDVAMSHGLSFRTYGEREQFVSSPQTAPQVRDVRSVDVFLCNASNAGIFVDIGADPDVSGRLRAGFHLPAAQVPVKLP